MARGKVNGRAVAPLDGPFIIVSNGTSPAKLDPATRKQVRSHVMRGKNRKPHSLHAKSTPGSWINGCQGVANSPKPRAHQDQGIPPRVGNDMTHIPFADEMSPYMLELTFKWFTVLKNAMYPVEACVQPGDRQWVEYLAYDRAYVHSVLTATQGFFDYIREARFSDRTMHYLNTSLSLLRHNLIRDDLATSDSTISTVLSLALMADLLEDAQAARQHIQGLYQIISLRGGIRSLRYNTELQSKVLRADLGIAISTGSKPLFFSSGFSWEPYLVPHPTPFPGSGNKNNNSNNNNNTPTTTTAFSPLTPDPRLLNIAADLQQFSLPANLAAQTGLKIPTDLFHETLVSAQYRLLALQHEHQQQQEQSSSISSSLSPSSPTDDDYSLAHAHVRPPADDMLRLGMLAFTTTTFLQIRQLPMRYRDLAARLRRAVSRMADDDNSEGGDDDLSRATLWFLFVARISVLGGAEDEPMLVRAARRVLGELGLNRPGVSGWGAVRDVLRRYMWIDWVHSERGKAFYEKLAE